MILLTPKRPLPVVVLLSISKRLCQSNCLKWPKNWKTIWPKRAKFNFWSSENVVGWRLQPIEGNFILLILFSLEVCTKKSKSTLVPARNIDTCHNNPTNTPRFRHGLMYETQHSLWNKWAHRFHLFHHYYISRPAQSGWAKPRRFQNGATDLL